MNIDLIYVLCVCNVQCGNAFRFPINVNNFNENLHQNRNANKSNKTTSFRSLSSILLSTCLRIGDDRHPLCGYCSRAHKIHSARCPIILLIPHILNIEIASTLIDSIFFLLFALFVQPIGIRKLLAHVLILNRSSTWKLRIEYPVNEAINLIHRIHGFFFFSFLVAALAVAVQRIEIKQRFNEMFTSNNTKLNSCFDKTENGEPCSHRLDEFST